MQLRQNQYKERAESAEEQVRSIREKVASLYSDLE